MQWSAQLVKNCKGKRKIKDYLTTKKKKKLCNSSGLGPPPLKGRGEHPTCTYTPPSGYAVDLVPTLAGFQTGRLSGWWGRSCMSQALPIIQMQAGGQITQSSLSWSNLPRSVPAPPPGLSLPSPSATTPPHFPHLLRVSPNISSCQWKGPIPFFKKLFILYCSIDG